MCLVLNLHSVITLSISITETTVTLSVYVLPRMYIKDTQDPRLVFPKYTEHIRLFGLTLSFSVNRET